MAHLAAPQTAETTLQLTAWKPLKRLLFYNPPFEAHKPAENNENLGHAQRPFAVIIAKWSQAPIIFAWCCLSIYCIASDLTDLLTWQLLWYECHVDKSTYHYQITSKMSLGATTLIPCACLGPGTSVETKRLVYALSTDKTRDIVCLNSLKALQNWTRFIRFGFVTNFTPNVRHYH